MSSAETNSGETAPAGNVPPPDPNAEPVAPEPPPTASLPVAEPVPPTPPTKKPDAGRKWPTIIFAAGLIAVMAASVVTAIYQGPFAPVSVDPKPTVRVPDPKNRIGVASASPRDPWTEPVVVPSTAPAPPRIAPPPAPVLPAPLKGGYHAKVRVGGPTRIEWTFTVGVRNRTLPNDYDSTKQQYDLFVPPDYNPQQSYPVVLFISPSTSPAGWQGWEPVCKEQGVIFASPYDAGNNTMPGQKRFRIVLDVLDDIRRNYNTDPDRTYICGFSGGGRVAARIAFGLPEYFGGVVCVGASGDFRNEEWLVHRLQDRLSVAMVAGDVDFNRGECELFKGPWNTELGIRSRVWLVPDMGHSIPGSKFFAEVFNWLEEDLPRRLELAKKYPGTRMAGNAAPSPDEWSKVLLAEAKQRLQTKETVYPGLALLQGIMIRWPGLPASNEALKIFSEWEKKPEKPWEEVRNKERRRYLYGRALGLTLYATGYHPTDRVAGSAGGELINPKKMSTEAIQLWEQIIKEGKDAKGIEEAKKRIPELRKITEAKE
jgi:pimeloyl-ACP methyl ester carboxylesterase